MIKLSELQEIFVKYQTISLPQIGCNVNELVKFSFAFFADVSEIYDIITRLKNTERNPSGFTLNDAPILGLLIKISKTLREMIAYYRAGDASIICLLEKQAVEAAIVAQYLLQASPHVIENYRKCSYRGRLEILEARGGERCFTSKLGKHLKKNIQAQLVAERLDETGFDLQKKHEWRIDGKNVRDMLTDLHVGLLYGYLYGIDTESVHASWGHSTKYDLCLNGDQTYSAGPVERSAEIQYMVPVIEVCNHAFVGWSERVQLGEHGRSLKWITDVNQHLLHAFDIAVTSNDK